MTRIGGRPVVKTSYPTAARHLLKVLLAVFVAHLLDRVETAEGQSLVLVYRWPHVFTVVARFHFLEEEMEGEKLNTNSLRLLLNNFLFTSNCRTQET